MKINVLRALIVPWLIFFCLSLAALVIIGIRFPMIARDPRTDMVILSVSSLFCLFLNIKTLNKAGIWIAYTLPISLRYHSWGWILRAVAAVAVAWIFYLVGQASWIPLIWQGFVIPAVFTLALFVATWNLMGPILKWGARVSFGRVAVFFLLLPMLALVGTTSLFLGHNIVVAYRESQPEPLMIVSAKTQPVFVETQATVAESKVPAAQSKDAEQFRAAAEAGKACPGETKPVQAALLDTYGKEDRLFWAIKALKCTDVKAVLGLPRLSDIMVKNPSARVRAAAIRAMPKFGTENVKRVGYLLVKRISDHEPAEVIEATTAVLPKLGEDETKWTTSRLKTLLDTSKSALAAKLLIRDLKRDDLVAEYVSEHLATEGPGRDRAVSMVCALPQASRNVAEPLVSNIVATVKSGSADDVAMQALDCLGRPGFQALRDEVEHPKNLDRMRAIRAMAQMDLRSSPEALNTVETCLKDSNEQVRQYCSQSLGKIGEPALPKILDLLKSGDSESKEIARNALSFFDDPQAKSELQKIRAENSGWMANRKKLQIADAVSTALSRITAETENQQPAPQSR